MGFCRQAQVKEGKIGSTGDVWVFSEKADLLAELIAGGMNWLTTAAAAWQPSYWVGAVEVDAALAHGAQRVLWLGERKADYLVDDYVPTLVDAVEGIAACSTAGRGNDRVGPSPGALQLAGYHCTHRCDGISLKRDRCWAGI
jgi:hypothetical protein